MESCRLFYGLAQICGVEKIFDFFPERLFNDRALPELQSFTDGVEGFGKIDR